MNKGAICAIISFVIYIGAIFSLPQVKNARYCCEPSSLAAAISNVIYGAPLGSLYSGVLEYLIMHLEEPLNQTLENL